MYFLNKQVYFSLFFYIDLKSATKPFNVLLACTRPQPVPGELPPPQDWAQVVASRI